MNQYTKLKRRTTGKRGGAWYLIFPYLFKRG
jgi:hypothetical protein